MHVQLAAIASLIAASLSSAPVSAQQKGAAPLTMAPGGPVPEVADKTLGQAIMGVYVLSNGDVQPLLSTGGYVSAIRGATGAYRVTFVRSLIGCTPVAFANSANRMIVVSGPVGADMEAWDVSTFDLSDNLADSQFSLLNFCGR